MLYTIGSAAQQIQHPSLAEATTACDSQKQRQPYRAHLLQGVFDFPIPVFGLHGI
jgi:hypothetical protein